MQRFSEVPYNQRQIKLMAQEIDMFLQEEISLGVLIRKLKGLFWALQSPDPSWKDDFINEWGSLEITYASDLYQKEQGLSSEGFARDGVSNSIGFVRGCVEKLNDIVKKEIIE